MGTPSSRAGRTACCVVLMMKSPPDSKRRLVEHLGEERATQAAERLLECAYEDLEAWSGPVCVAPEATGGLAPKRRVDAVVRQGDGTLGERINRVNDALARRGFERQLFIGIDCPTLDLAYLERAAAALADHDAVLGPAADGGVVLMGVRGAWPPLAALPWSTAALFESLRAACESAGSRTAALPPLRDVDTLADLLALRVELSGDPRPARRDLARWIAAQPDLAR